MPSSDRIVSVDIETTGVDPEIHEPWEIAVVPFDSSKPPLHFQCHVANLQHADPSALRVGGFYDRFTWPVLAVGNLGSVAFSHNMLEPSLVGEGDEAEHKDFTVLCSYEAGRQLAEALDGSTLLGCNVHFDAEFLRNWLQALGLAPSWSHRHLDLGSFCAGAWGGTIPLSSKAISDRYPNDRVHTALGDAEWNMHVYREIVGSQVM